MQKGGKVKPNPKPVMKRRAFTLSLQPQSCVNSSIAIIRALMTKDFTITPELRKNNRGEKIYPMKIPVHLAQI